MADLNPPDGTKQSYPESLKLALEHSRAWFTLHAGQRMQLVNFFLAAVAFLTAAYVAAFDSKEYPLATAVALVGLFSCVAFNRLETRTRELVKAGERAMEVLEKVLAENTGIPDLQLIAAVDRPAHPFTAYSSVIPVLQGLAAAAYIFAAVYAGYRSA